ncbi:uncharacterized protein [Anabrus simplex]|uniref:uncharacterized protein n=1 Tax=Anabrus simplex TaxID=316456 RepID=UPI0035A32021
MLVVLHGVPCLDEDDDDSTVVEVENDEEADEEIASRDHLAELLSLSELPLDKLIKVRESFARSEEPESELEDEIEDYDVPDVEDSASSTSPAALPLVDRRGSPLRATGRHKTSPTTPPPVRRGMMWEEEEEAHPWMMMSSGGKGKGKGISKIFQMSITTLAFLAFGGYLLCLIIQAVRNGTMMNMAAAGTTAGMVPANGAMGGAPAPMMSTLIFAPLTRPSGRRRRRRDAMNATNNLDQFEGMYRALTMIAEGYSLYHSTYVK